MEDDSSLAVLRKDNCGSNPSSLRKNLHLPLLAQKFSNPEVLRRAPRSFSGNILERMRTLSGFRGSGLIGDGDGVLGAMTTSGIVERISGLLFDFSFGRVGNEVKGSDSEASSDDYQFIHQSKSTSQTPQHTDQKEVDRSMKLRDSLIYDMDSRGCVVLHDDLLLKAVLFVERELALREGLTPTTDPRTIVEKVWSEMVRKKSWVRRLDGISLKLIVKLFVLLVHPGHFEYDSDATRCARVRKLQDVEIHGVEHLADMPILCISDGKSVVKLAPSKFESGNDITQSTLIWTGGLCTREEPRREWMCLADPVHVKNLTLRPGFQSMEYGNNADTCFQAARLKVRLLKISMSWRKVKL